MSRGAADQEAGGQEDNLSGAGTVHQNHPGCTHLHHLPLCLQVNLQVNLQVKQREVKFLLKAAGESTGEGSEAVLVLPLLS